MDAKSTEAKAAGKARASLALTKLKDFWANSQKSMAAVAVFAVVASVVVVIMLWTASDRYRPLYSTSSNYDSSQILELLDESKIPYQLSKSDGNIMVQESRVYEVRKYLAAKGLQEKIPVGIEILDEGSTLGQSQFMEEARYRHALEGELAKSIVTLDSVSYARVHLAVVKESLFSRNAPTKSSSASVIVSLLQGHDLKPVQIDSIVNLVAGAVNGLREENVRIVDQHGRLLSDDATVGDYTMSTSRQRDYQSQVERRLVQQASDILTPVLGPSNFRIQVVADIDFTKTEETEESYSDPVVRRETRRVDTNESSMALGIPGALSNTPPITDSNMPADNKRSIEKSETASEYALTGRVTHRVHQQGVVEKISVSVVLNGEFEEDDPVQLKVIDLVEAAVGFDDGRGDKLVVTALPFMQVEQIEIKAPAWYANSEVQEMVKSVVAGLIGLVLIFKVLVPLLRTTIIPEKSSSEGARLGESEVSDPGGVGVNVEAEPDMMMPTPDSPIEDQIKHVKMIAEKDKDRVVEVMKRWMNN
ncbi:flagellar basal-body MS-ring/collar protein FliF [Vibrio mediterranei]|uniref:flagellar basal-body MS-ring/collar protein FliF n=1 Tax=Vibrio mediterranei TaxID=689 RepID=UPI00406967F1